MNPADATDDIIERRWAKAGKAIWHALINKYGAEAVAPYMQGLDVPPPPSASLGSRLAADR